MNKLFKYLTLAAAAAGFSTMAYAIPELFISDGTNNVLLSDNNLLGGTVADTNSTLGMIGWSGTLGSSVVNVAFGITYPALGSLASPSLDMTINQTGNGQLFYYLIDNGFGPTSGNVQVSIGGTAAGSVTDIVAGGTSNVMGDGSNLLASEGPFGPGAFSGTFSGGSINNAGPYSLMQVLVINNGPTSGVTSVDALMSVPDAGMTLLLLGAGLTGLALIGRRQKRVC